MKTPINNILVAVDSFKGSLSTRELSDAVETGIRQSGIGANVVSTPIADGGEGTCDTLLEGVGGERISLSVAGPLFEKVTASYVILDDGTAIIEMAASSGLPLVPESLRNPMNTSTYGVGELIKDAIARGCRNFIIGIGGSATNDGGIGMLAALGYRFLDADGLAVTPVGGSLEKIIAVEINDVLKRLDDCRFLVACDVENTLYGENGAAYVFGPQKGADEDCVQRLDKGLRQWAKVIKKSCGISVDNTKGAGAAGGLGVAFYAFLHAELRPGVDIIFEHLGIEELVRQADMVITGEGRLDFQSVMGKAPTGIARLGLRYGKPVVGIAGSVTDDAVRAYDKGITAMFSVTDGPMSLETAMDKVKATHLVSKTVEQIMRLIASM